MGQRQCHGGGDDHLKSQNQSQKSLGDHTAGTLRYGIKEILQSAYPFLSQVLGIVARREQFRMGGGSAGVTQVTARHR
jgi:hypothetical protein